MSNVPSQILAQGAFGETIIGELVPRAQAMAVNGINDNMIQQTSGTGSTISAVNSNFVIESGTGAQNKTRLLTLAHASYRPGQGIRCRITALWESSAAQSAQIAGFLNSDAAWGFGYNQTEFGILRAYFGEVEIQYLDITTPATGAENATVTVNGVAYTVPLTAGTANHNAYEMAVSLQAQVPDYVITSNLSQVQAASTFSEPAGAFAFTSATAVASWTQQNAGAVPNQDFVPIADWNPGISWDLDPTKGNVFQIVMQYLGYGGIKFYVENPNTSNLELVHTYSYANQHITPSVEDPTFRVGWSMRNVGNTTNLIMRGASVAAFNEGQYVLDDRGSSLSATKTGIDTTLINMVTIRNRTNLAIKLNREAMIPSTLYLSAEHNKTVFFRAYLGGTFTGSPTFQYFNETQSVVEYTTDTITYNGDGKVISIFPVRGIGTLQISLNEAVSLLYPGEYIVLAVQADSGTGAEADYSLFWREDH